MTEEQVIDVNSEVVIEDEIPVAVEEDFTPPVKTKEEREYERNQLKFLKKLMKQKRRYYKSNLFAIRRMDSY